MPKVLIEFATGKYGHRSLYVADRETGTRIAGEKPWAGVRHSYDFEVEVDAVEAPPPGSGFASTKTGQPKTRSYNFRIHKHDLETAHGDPMALLASKLREVGMAGPAKAVDDGIDKQSRDYMREVVTETLQLERRKCARREVRS